LSLSGQLFEGFDGYSLPAVARSGQLDILVWSQQSLSVSLTKQLHIGPNVNHEELQLNLPFNFTYNPLVKVMVMSYKTLIIYTKMHI